MPQENLELAKRLHGMALAGDIARQLDAFDNDAADQPQEES